jgi:hypothetical protein
MLEAGKNGRVHSIVLPKKQVVMNVSKEKKRCTAPRTGKDQTESCCVEWPVWSRLITWNVGPLRGMFSLPVFCSG